ncbi:MAG: hypothetical protein NXI26_04675, partial [bacterium]|nr:hypothetical protein [bacterium]
VMNFLVNFTYIVAKGVWKSLEISKYLLLQLFVQTISISPRFFFRQLRLIGEATDKILGFNHPHSVMERKFLLLSGLL